MGRPTKLVITVDCDLRHEDVGVRQQTLDLLLEVFAEVGAAGRITWFLNENDFHITENHGAFLSEILRRGDAIGVHDHFEPFKGIYEREPIRAFCAQSKQRVEAWLAAHGHDCAVTLHRNGCLAQAPGIYAALGDLGYEGVSEVYPGFAMPDRENHPSFDNRDVPEGIAPFRHDAENFKDFRCRAGRFLHFPVFHMGLLELDFPRMERWLATFERDQADLRVLVWLFHPYEVFARPGWREISPDIVKTLRSHLARCRDEYRLQFASLRECVTQNRAMVDRR